MKRFLAAFPAALALSALATTTALADAAADAAPAASSRAANTPSSSPSAAQRNASLRAQATEQAATAASSRKFVCLSVSLQCFRVASASASAPARPLDLRAPDIRRLVPEAELRKPVEPEWLTREQEEEQQVRVEGARPDVYVPGGIASLPWAIRNPTQAWRIFLPVPASQTK